MYNNDLPLISNRAFGGTLTLWKRSLEPFIKIINVNTSSFLPLLLSIPGCPTSVHINIYLPTAGLTSEYVSALSSLENAVEEILEEHGDIHVFIRGDANAAIPSRPNNARDKLFQYFCQRLFLVTVETGHKTYHHFMGEGLSDSSIDVFLHRTPGTSSSEKIVNIFCSKNDPRVDSKHDAVYSTFNLPLSDNPSQETLGASFEVPNLKHKIHWHEDHVPAYQTLLSARLLQIQADWSNPASPVSFSLLLQLTNEALTSAAKQTHKSTDLSKEFKPRKYKTPPEVSKSSVDKKAAHNNLKAAHNNPESTEVEVSTATTAYSDARKAYRRVFRRHQAQADNESDSKIHDILSKNPSEAFKHLKKCKSSSSSKISEIHVGDSVYTGENVAFGFFTSLQQLKTIQDPSIDICETCKSFKLDLEMITELCQAGDSIPPLSIDDAESLLHSFRPSVCDHWNISASHYINGGPVALKHYQMLLNAALENIENTSVDEVNTAHACVLYKGHKKDKTLASSYRNISTCPFIAKSLDTYIRSLSSEDWERAKSSSQFLGSGMSHDLASLLLSEAILHSLYTNKKPLFALFVDARSAFDRALREILVRKLYLHGTTGDRLLFFNNRLQFRKTFCEWDRKVLGPINDLQGVEQGGVPSGDLYVVYNNEQLDCAQDSGLGLDIHGLQVAAIGQADDCVLVSDDLFCLKNLLELTMDYCRKYHVLLAPEKTKLIAFTTPKHKADIGYLQLVNNIHINETPITFTATAEHVGLVRSSDNSNLPHVLDRISNHKRALFGVLPAGLARRHNSNPAASLRIQNVHALPVLLSGLGSIQLANSETTVLEKHYKNTLRCLMKLPDKCPDSVIYFLAGSLPLSAHIHKKQLNIFGMITRLPGNVLFKLANKILWSEPDTTKSWFIDIRHLCSLYNLPSPLQLLSKPLSKAAFKSQITQKVLDHWQTGLRKEAFPMTSLIFFNPNYMSLSSPHPVWTTCSSNPFEVNKALVQASLVSGRYRSDYLSRHWNHLNPHGFCLLCPGKFQFGTVQHLLLHCEALSEKRSKVINMWSGYAEDDGPLHQLLKKLLQSPPELLTRFLLDPSVVPEAVNLCQQKLVTLSSLFYLTRTWCYGLHRRRLQLLGKFQIL